jgi:hypothetical protein
MAPRIVWFLSVSTDGINHSIGCYTLAKPVLSSNAVGLRIVQLYVDCFNGVWAS